MIWIVLLLAGLITFGIRFSFVYFLGRIHIPSFLERALVYVPAAVLSAIIVPSLVIDQGQLNISLENPHLLAGIVAILIAAMTRNMFLTILVGLAALFVLKSAGL